MNWYYLSFAEENDFLGGVYIEADTEVAAWLWASAQGINPGGEALILGPISDADMDANVPAAKRGRLLSKAELEPGEEVLL